MFFKQKPSKSSTTTSIAGESFASSSSKQRELKTPEPPSDNTVVLDARQRRKERLGQIGGNNGIGAGTVTAATTITSRNERNFEMMLAPYGKPNSAGGSRLSSPPKVVGAARTLATPNDSDEEENVHDIAEYDIYKNPPSSSTKPSRQEPDLPVISLNPPVQDKNDNNSIEMANSFNTAPGKSSMVHTHIFGS